ncbi:MAG: DUF1501 domain-containing protein [Myxococcota bacterium]
MNRRSFLLRSGGLGLAGSLARLPLARTARADETEDYRALVCVYLSGGMDNWDTVIPYDATAYAEYERHRRSFLSAYTTPRDPSTLVPFAAGDSFGSRQFALPSEMAGLVQLYAEGKAAIVGNVGPLLEPVTRASYADQTARLPSRLFSHNDQASTWQAGGPEGTTSGWGGRFMDALSSRNGAAEFGAITTGDNDLFVTGRSTVPYQVSVDGASRILALSAMEEDFGSEAPAWLEVLRQHFRPEPGAGRSLLEQDVRSLARRSFDANALYDRAQRGVPAFQTLFPPSDAGAQLQAVARAIVARSSLSAGRQVFVIGLGGFDTHSAQAQTLPMDQAGLAGGIVAFQRAMEELGLDQQVTLFTASEFGRTLAVNGDGTDHGWGGHQFVVGSAVRGGQVYGELPEATLGHALDAGGGRLIPSLSVEQYAAPLGRWFGLSPSELELALPGLANFPSPLPSFV